MAFRTGQEAVVAEQSILPTSLQTYTTPQLASAIGMPQGNAVAIAAWAAMLASAGVGGYAVGKQRKGWGKWVLLAIGGLAPGGLALALGGGALGYYQKQGLRRG